MYIQKYTKDGRKFEQPTAFYRVAIKLFIFDDKNRLLVLQDTKSRYYELPGGGWDHGEPLDQAINREVNEELGVNLKSFDDNPTAVLPGLHPNGYSTIKIYYFAKVDDYNFKLESGLIYKFVTRDEFVQLPMPGDESPILQHSNKIWA